MESLRRASVLLALNDQLRKVGSWAGETHMQKSCYFLQELMHVPLDFDFILYKHGPFSFDLRDQLTAMRAEGFLRLEPQYPYGPSLVPGDKSELLRNEYMKTIEEYVPKIRFVSQKLGTKSVAELERISTALYVKLQDDPKSRDDLARSIRKLKPHIDLSDARAAVSEIEDIIREKDQT